MQKEGLECTDKGLEIFEKLSDRNMIAGGYRNYGIIYGRRKKWEKSKKYF